MIINLLSDTITKPTEGMLEAMLNAEVGDDVFSEDPTANALQEKAARMFGMEAALFFPSGTMANQTAIRLHTQPGEQVICDHYAHIYNYEGGGPAVNSGVTCKLINGFRGMFTAEQVKANISDPDDIHATTSRLVEVENTTNKGGGACWDFEELKKIKKVCISNDLTYHLDGARLFNALVAKGEKPLQYGQLFDTISICLSKGLGCPIGSILLGSKKHIKKALRIRKVMGGAMRQIGYLAAAGIYALDNHIERLSDDHDRAKQIADVLKSLPYIKKVELVETNIIIFYVNDNVNESDFVQKLKEENIIIISMGQGKLRMVTHLDVTDEMIDILLDKLSNLKF